ncbi:MAG: hypothetical protein ACE5PT_01965, partial [Gemmatimonadales bacterium]
MRLARRAGLGIAGVATALTVACGDDTTAPPQPTVGSLVVSVTGLPAGTDADVTVTGPGGFTQQLTTSDTLIGLEPGTYTLSADSVLSQQQTYAASPDTQAVSVTAGSTAAQASVSYAQVTGDLAVTAAGLPTGVDAALVVTGPAELSWAVTGADTLVGIPAGTYTVTATDTVVEGHRWTPDSTTRTVVVVAAAMAEVVVTYMQATGSLVVSVTGLPAGTDADV